MKTLIIGAGDYGQHLAAMMQDSSALAPKTCFATEFEQEDEPRELMGASVLRLFDVQQAREPFRYIIAIQNSQARERIARECDDAGGGAFGFMHKSACDLSPTEAYRRPGVSIGEFCCVHPNTEIGAHVIILSHSMIGFGSRIMPFATISHHVNLLRDARVLEHAFIGTAAVIFPGVTVGRFAKVGANATVMRDVPDFGTAVGVWK